MTDKKSTPKTNNLPAPLSYRKIGQHYVVTTEAGEYTIVDESLLQDLLKGNLKEELDKDNLRERGFVSEPAGLAHTVRRLQQRKGFLNKGPNLHILVVTLRCDHKCIYCHASRAGMDDEQFDMTEETASAVINTVMQSTSPEITIEFQGGEPLANFERVKHITDLAIEEAQKKGKTLDLSLVTSMSLMDEEKAQFLLDRKVQICTSLDGPADLHDAIRPRKGESGHKLAVHWIKKINEMYKERGMDPDLYHVDALVTVTKQSLGRVRDIIDEYIRLGLKTIHLRPLNPLGVASQRSGKVGYSPEEFLKFYREGFQYILMKNLEGVEILEKLASVFLSKIFDAHDPGYLDIRSPCGGSIGQLAYDYDGSVFTCDEGRMVSRMGDPAFQVGHVSENSYDEMISSPASKVVCLSSCLEGSPACLACAYRPYCGTCPVLNYSQHGTPFGVIPETDRCKIHKGIMDEIFSILADGDEKAREVLERWPLKRPRPEFIYGANPE